MKLEIGKPIQQGEVYIKRLAEPPKTEGLTVVKETSRGFILSHSESGHHHILTGGTVLERPMRKEGLDAFYAILENPEEVIQDAANPHGSYSLPAGFYDIRISREHNPFTEQARRVAD